MTVLTTCSLLLFPRININEDMARYLPDDSRMKQGLDSLKANFTGIDLNAYCIRAMFSGVGDRDSLANVLAGLDGVADISSVEEKDGLVLYQMSVEKGADTKTIAAGISATYGDSVVVEHNANSIMPENMGMILMIGLAIVFGILFLMCSSLVEALLFILTLGMAVIMNIGTNSLLPSVSMLTNTIVAVLQFVLSMDYSIILMNRFRQVLGEGEDVGKAMNRALKAASPSILSSGLTTIFGLLALLFMKFKIGMDLGLVLAKGVLFSLVSIYTILPALILIFYKAIRKTEKRVFLVPTDHLAGFELKARFPLAVLFAVIFVLSWKLSSRTELSYASIWESRINEVFPPKNNFSLLYRTSSEDSVIALTDSIASDANVVMVLDYPSLFKKEMTAEEMCGNIRSLISAMSAMSGTSDTGLPLDSKLLTPEILRFLYYAATHPERNERMSFEDMIQLAEEASKNGLLPEGIDIGTMMDKFQSPDIPAAPSAPAAVSVPVAPPAPSTPSAPEAVPVNGAVHVAAGQEEEEESGDERMSLKDIAGPKVDESGDDPYSLHGKYHFTKEGLGTAMDAAGIADYLGFSKGQASAAFSMAKKRNGTMTPYEFINYMIEKVLSNKLLRKLISDKQAEGLYYIRGEMDAVLTSAESPVPSDSSPIIPQSSPAAQADFQDSPVFATAPVTQALPLAAPDTLKVKAPQTPEPIAVAEETPLERLAGMYASGQKYSAAQIYSSLHSAGINVVDRAAVNLMFTYYGSRRNYDESTRMSLDDIIGFLSEDVAVSDDYAMMLDDSTRVTLSGLRAMVNEGIGMLRKDEWSMAAVVTDYPIESEATFDFVENTLSACDGTLGPGNSYLIGESVMYKEMKDGFQRELLFLTLLTVISIFLIVALTFKSALIPTILVMTVMTGVHMNVFFSGLGDRSMLYLAYLIVQSILMGATIDYGILFTNYYLGFRRDGKDVREALRLAYSGSIHTIMTSGLIIILAPFIMSRMLTDPTICSILSSLTFGAFSAIFLIIFVLPALLAASDRLICRKHISNKV